MKYELKELTRLKESGQKLTRQQKSDLAMYMASDISRVNFNKDNIGDFLNSDADKSKWFRAYSKLICETKNVEIYCADSEIEKIIEYREIGFGTGRYYRGMGVNEANPVDLSIENCCLDFCKPKTYESELFRELVSTCVTFSDFAFREIVCGAESSLKLVDFVINNLRLQIAKTIKAKIVNDLSNLSNYKKIEKITQADLDAPSKFVEKLWEIAMKLSDETSEYNKQNAINQECLGRIIIYINKKNYYKYNSEICRCFNPSDISLTKNFKVIWIPLKNDIQAILSVDGAYVAEVESWGEYQAQCINPPATKMMNYYGLVFGFVTFKNIVPVVLDGTAKIDLTTLQNITNGQQIEVDEQGSATVANIKKVLDPVVLQNVKNLNPDIEVASGDIKVEYFDDSKATKALTDKNLKDTDATIYAKVTAVNEEKVIGEKIVSVLLTKKE